jgi:hypothetical protein
MMNEVFLEDICHIKHNESVLNVQVPSANFLGVEIDAMSVGMIVGTGFLSFLISGVPASS